MKKNRKYIKMLAGAAVAALLAVTLATPATAMKPHSRDSWLVGVSYGYSEGNITWGDGSNPERELGGGATPQIRVGKMMGSKFALGLDYNGWMLEGVELEPDPDSDTVESVRSSLQSVSLTGTWYPGGGSQTTLSGFYARGGVGFAWAGLAFVDVDRIPPEHVPLDQEHGDRTDETGLALNGQLGYEFRLSNRFAAGLGVGVNYVSIGKEIYDSAYYFPVTLTGLWYW